MTDGSSVHLDQSERCKCGDVALGRCADCGHPVCRAHSVFLGDDLVCDGDVVARKTQQSQDRMDAYMAAVEEMDARTGSAVSRFLDAAAAIEPERITLSKKKVPTTVPGPKRLFGRRGPDRMVEKWEYEHAPGYRIFSWIYRDHGDPPHEESQHLYLLKSGELILEGGYEGFDAWWPFGRQQTGTGGYIRGVGMLPGFLSHSPTARPITPGLPEPPETAVLSRSAEWLEERLSEFLVKRED